MLSITNTAKLPEKLDLAGKFWFVNVLIKLFA